MQYFLTAIILFVIFRRPILRYFAKYMTRKFEKAAQQGGFGFQNKQQQKRESSSHQDGETFISSNKKGNMKNTSTDSEEGDYVDFEEV